MAFKHPNILLYIPQFSRNIQTLALINSTTKLALFLLLVFVKHFLFSGSGVGMWVSYLEVKVQLHGIVPDLDDLVAGRCHVPAVHTHVDRRAWGPMNVVKLRGMSCHY